ncbi:outer membrane lipoprotein carrier protein LolA [Cupriavidus gilardii]|uniref:Outer membrane lipoprotein carrier protein LolA n=1 Tax=Cupriavidus gilardii TaxID=82541 RepID=A0A849BAJ4_9BURK|nr:outer membrane lipoprotein carrier protein LolA [Cupriavidus gilardii]MCT9013216.1 outer membrane lipoprotein carrier protein LolA [Cupriavidus gilardii]MCT9052770.1 outer membrane lipoprotein carrier protein LolA [Cupriavidus gilardii]NNH12810.1 outer membrane lipoprotein carrier protein LolA [Cupriavidus gilardii]
MTSTATARASADAAWSVDRLMATLARQPSGSARFVEKKYIAMLERPLESSGELRFVAPDRLEKRTLAPKPETLLVQGDMLTVERAGRKTTIPLGNHPELAGFIESLRGTLAGNRQALEQYYRLALEGSARRWTLTLTPSDSRMAAAIAAIRIDGAGERLERVEIRQADGDRSVMTIVPTGGQ